MQRAPSGQRQPEHHGAAPGGFGTCVRGVVHGVQQFLRGVQPGDADWQCFPAHQVHRAEFQADRAVVVHLHQVDAARARFAGMAALRVAGIDHRGPVLPQHLAGMDVAQRPVVKAGVGQVGDRAGGVGVVVRVAAHVGVEQADAEPAGNGGFGKERRQVIAHLAARVADAIDGGPLRFAGEHWLAGHLRAEADTARRQGQPSLPAVQRVVVAVAHEGADACRVQPVQPVHELQLRPKAAVGPVVDVPGHQQRIHALANAQRDDVVIGIKGGAAQRIGDVTRRFAANAAKRAVQMQVGGVNELQASHVCPGLSQLPV